MKEAQAQNIDEEGTSETSEGVLSSVDERASSYKSGSKAKLRHTTHGVCDTTCVSTNMGFRAWGSHMKVLHCSFRTQRAVKQRREHSCPSPRD